MGNQQDFNWVFDHDYCGLILKGAFSNALKKRVADAIHVFRTLNTPANPATPYISAWRETVDDHAIWYEFVGNRLLDLLGCRSCEVAEIFRDSVQQRCSYQYADNTGAIAKSVHDRSELPRIQSVLRAEGKNNGMVEAIYKVALGSGRVIWLKDQATVESFSEDQVCLSCGALTDVTKEMAAEEQDQQR